MNPDQPKPTDEWTRETVLAIARQHIGADAISNAVADAHNAALAAERERSKELSEDCEHYSEVIDKLEQQLAAEREQHKLVCDVVEEKLVRMKKQLAAERERADKAAARAELAQIQLAEVKEVL